MTDGPDAFRRQGHAMVDRIADYLEGIEAQRVVPDVEPGFLRRALPVEAPEAPEPLEAVLADFDRLVMPGMAHWQHPRWFAYFPANTSPPAILGEMLASGLGAQCMSWQTSPAATELEQVVMEWLRRLVGMPEGLVGSIQDTASTATLTALIVARERGGTGAPVVYASSEAHASVAKAVRLAGFGPGSLRLVGVDDRFAMRPDLLASAIEGDLAAGRRPAAIVATVGTTSSTAVDPVGEIGEIAARHGAWLHVDAAYAGSAAICPEFRWLVRGWEHADSVVFNPHKWLLTNFDCSAFYVRDPDALVRTFGTSPAYLHGARDAEVVNYRDWGIPLGRRFRALKLWFVLRCHGAEGLRAHIRHGVALARSFRDWVEAAPGWEVVAPSPLGLVCFRHLPAGGASAEELDSHNRALLDRVNAGGRTHLTGTTLGGRWVLRLAAGGRLTEERHVREAWEVLQAASTS